jgi:hypothetical protein
MCNIPRILGISINLPDRQYVLVSDTHELAEQGGGGGEPRVMLN